MSAVSELVRQETAIDGLHVQTYGDRSAPALLMSAGLGGSGTYWAPQILDFARDRFVILYDHRGTGRSDRSNLPSPYDVLHMADDIRIVLDGLRVESADLIGHAAGGVAGLALAARSPERVISLTVVNGWLRAPRHFQRCMEVRQNIFVAGGAQAYLRAQPIYLYPAEWIERNFDHLEAERDAQAASFQCGDTLFARMDALKRFDFSHESSAYRTPTLLVVCDDDALVPAVASQELARALPGAHLERFSSGGHAINVTRPDQFNAIVRSYLQ